MFILFLSCVCGHSFDLVKHFCHVFAPSVEEAQWLIGRPKVIEIWDKYISEDLPGIAKHDGLEIKNF